MTNHVKNLACSAILLLSLLFIFPIKCAAEDANDQKAVDAMYLMAKKYAEKLTAVFGETGKTTDGKEFPCHNYEVSQYGQDFSTFGPPKAVSTSITFSSQEETYSGIYLTIYIINSNKKAESFLKMMSDDWVPNTKFHGLPAIELKTSDSVTNFFFICGRYIIREEAFNAQTIREELYSAVNALNLCKDTEYKTAAEKETQPSEEIKEELPAPAMEEETQPETTTTEEETTESEQQTEQETEAETETQPQPEQQTEEPSAVEEQTTLPEATPYEPWMNSWQIVSSALRTKYVFDSVSSSTAPAGGGYRMIALKPKDSRNPAVIEGRFKPKTYQSALLMRIAGIKNPNASAFITVEVNGYPVLREKVIRGAEGWQDLNVNIGGLNPSFAVVQIKVYPDPSAKTGLSIIYIDDIAVDGTPVINKKLNIVSDDVPEENGEKPFLNVQGLWTDLRNFRYNVRQKGNTFTFSCSEMLNDYLWEVNGEGKIESETRISLSFTEKYAPLGKIAYGNMTGTYDKSRKMINWTGKDKYFPGEWIFIK